MNPFVITALTYVLNPTDMYVRARKKMAVPTSGPPLYSVRSTSAITMADCSHTKGAYRVRKRKSSKNDRRDQPEVTSGRAPTSKRKKITRKDGRGMEKFKVYMLPWKHCYPGPYREHACKQVSKHRQGAPGQRTCTDPYNGCHARARDLQQARLPCCRRED